MSTAASRPRSEPALRLVVMGVAGSGKSAVAAALAARLGRVYLDGDDLHPADNVAKMAGGTPLDDEDRWPWLGRVAEVLAADERATGLPPIVACSALKRRYRAFIAERTGAPVGFVHLVGEPGIIAARLAARQEHFMPAALLASQFAALEPPGPDENAITVPVDRPLAEVVDGIVAQLEALRR